MKITITRKDAILFSFLNDNDLSLISDEIPEEIEPKESTVNNILNYSKALWVVNTKSIENVHLILN